MSRPHGNRAGVAGQAEHPAVEWWVFDVDGCLIDSLTGSSLRPGARELVEALGSTSQVLLWSAGGEDYARARSEQGGLDAHVGGYFAKAGRDDDGCYQVAHLPVDPARTVFVDDRPEDLAANLEVQPVSPYLSQDPHDHGLDVVVRRAGLERQLRSAGRPAG